jgi:hypothetical protein
MFAGGDIYTAPATKWVRERQYRAVLREQIKNKHFSNSAPIVDRTKSCGCEADSHQRF